MKWILHNIWIKLLAILMAFLLWFHVATEKEHEVDLRYHLAYEGLADDLILAVPPPEDVMVRCRGTGKRLLTLLFDERLWPVNLADSTPGPVKIELTAHDVPQSEIARVEFLYVVGQPPFWLDIDRLQHKTVPITSTFIYQMQEGYIRVGPETLDPDSVVVTGPARAIKDITNVQTRPRTFADLTEPVDAKTKLAPPTMYNVTINTDECRLYADVQQYDETTLEQVPIYVPRRRNRPLATMPDKVTVKIGGGERALRNLDSTLVRVFVDSLMINTMVIDTLPRPVALYVDLPPEYNLIDVQPDTVFISRR